jgi:crotonobetainyl-CoA:carnitine CoA-transferase CaiB-like acyl-CoA transferase
MADRPLQGLLVVDLSRLLPGPLAARLLADLGARVVKIEEPALGDPLRQAPPFARGRSALAAILLSGVESLALDLKRPAAAEVLEALLGRADVLLATFRPGGLARLGLGAEELRRRFPRLVLCSLTGWGEDGPQAGKAGHDLTYQAVAGMLAPTAAMPAAPVADIAGAWSAVAAILAALVERGGTGRGTAIDASLYDAAVHANLASWAAEAGRPRAVGERLPLTGALPCYDLYRTADGAYLALAALEGKFWRRFCRLAGRRDLVRRAYSSDPAVHAQVAGVVASRTRRQWERLLAGEDLPIEIVLSAEEAATHPQAKERRVLVEGPDRLPRLAFPARLDGERPPPGGALPEVGEHTEALLAEFDLPAARLSPRERRAAGIGRRPRARRLLLRLAARLFH